MPPIQRSVVPRLRWQTSRPCKVEGMRSLPKEPTMKCPHCLTIPEKGGTTMSKLVKIAETKDVSPGTAKVVEAEGGSFALFNVAGTFYAIDNTCTHVGGPLGEGELAGEVVTCPW